MVVLIGIARKDFPWSGKMKNSLWSFGLSSVRQVTISDLLTGIACTPIQIATSNSPSLEKQLARLQVSTS